MPPIYPNITLMQAVCLCRSLQQPMRSCETRGLQQQLPMPIWSSCESAVPGWRLSWLRPKQLQSHLSTTWVHFYLHICEGLKYNEAWSQVCSIAHGRNVSGYEQAMLVRLSRPLSPVHLTDICLMLQYTTTSQMGTLQRSLPWMGLSRRQGHLSPALGVAWTA